MEQTAWGNCGTSIIRGAQKEVRWTAVKDDLGVARPTLCYGITEPFLGVCGPYSCPAPFPPPTLVPFRSTLASQTTNLLVCLPHLRRKIDIHLWGTFRNQSELWVLSSALLNIRLSAQSAEQGTSCSQSQSNHSLKYGLWPLGSVSRLCLYRDPPDQTHLVLYQCNVLSP